MKSKKGFMFTLLIIFLIVGIMVYPTIYRYDVLKKGDNESLFKINRITGKVYKFNDNTFKWEDNKEVMKRQKEERVKELESYIESTAQEVVRLKNIGYNTDEYTAGELFKGEELVRFRASGLSKDVYIGLYIKKLEREVEQSKTELKGLK